MRKALNGRTRKTLRFNFPSRYLANYRAIIVSLALIAFPFKSYSQNINNNILRVGLDEFPPWNMTTGQVMSGINVEVIKMLAENMGLTLEFKVCPWKRCLKLMSAGKIDLLPGVLKKGDREEYMRFIAPAYKTQSNKVFYTLGSHSQISDEPAVKIDSFGDLYSYSIGVVVGVKYFDAFDKSYQLNKVEVTGNKQLIAMLRRKRIDTFIGTESQIDYQLLKNDSYQGISKANYQYRKPTAVHLTLSRLSPHFKDAKVFDTEMLKMLEQGKVDQITKEFYRKLTYHGL